MRFFRARVALSFFGLAAALAAALVTPARAIVGGNEGGPLAASAVMVLSSRGGFCSGVVVAPAAVLTAGHCVAGAADIRVHHRDAAAEPVLIAPRDVRIHPEFRADAARARRRSVDLALILLPAPLAGFEAATLGGGRLPAGGDVIVAGFGLAGALGPRSGGRYRSAALAVTEPYGPSTILLWARRPAGAAKEGAGACQGDSGGPLVSGDSVVAITSWSTGAGRAGCGQLTQGILVAPQRGWIDEILGGWGETARWAPPP